MNKKLMSITVIGKNAIWGFEFYGDPENLEMWQRDGLDIVCLENTIPEWVADFNLVKPWCFLQDIFNFKNPFKNGGKNEI